MMGKNVPCLQDAGIRIIDKSRSAVHLLVLLLQLSYPLNTNKTKQKDTHGH